MKKLISIALVALMAAGGAVSANAAVKQNKDYQILSSKITTKNNTISIYTYNMKNTGRPMGLKSVSSEKYKSRYIDCPNEPLYPFGYGLSYTTFEYSDIHPSSVIAEEGDTLQFSVNVTNTGNVDGEEVVQLYIRDMKGSVTRPVKELKGFKKIMIKAGESRKVTFNLSPEDLSFTRKDMTWGQEKGEYKLWIGGDSNANLEASFTIK
ncbi:fibronectin type III-like domain-contianing protein [Ruminococcus sp.]|uniref:fibronectin type III-like domain-contianing protein n=1 Tax=Ruminococcus sp. TaxID=41978 RepID=UPI0025FB71A4|nr:fibronectin type III-like domain-contianing protein [Ruminococcus sp.]